MTPEELIDQAYDLAAEGHTLCCRQCWEASTAALLTVMAENHRSIDGRDGWPADDIAELLARLDPGSLSTRSAS